MAIFTLGIVLPIVMLAQAYSALSRLQNLVTAPRSEISGLYAIGRLKALNATANDYALLAMTSSEESNQRVVTNKQLMKITVMQVGFAVASVGLMFIVLGVKGGGGSGAVKWLNVQVDFKTTSTGLVAVVLGAAMVTGGGAIKNDYNTVPLPNFLPLPPPPEAAGPTAKEAQALRTYRECRTAYPAQVNECFGKLFPALYAKELENGV